MESLHIIPLPGGGPALIQSWLLQEVGWGEGSEHSHSTYLPCHPWAGLYPTEIQLNPLKKVNFSGKNVNFSEKNVTFSENAKFSEKMTLLVKNWDRTGLHFLGKARMG